MKKIIKTVFITTVCGAFLFASCKKDYHCQCSYNNQVRLVKDLGFEYKKNATDECNNYDSTVTGEVWNCVIY